MSRKLLIEAAVILGIALVGVSYISGKADKVDSAADSAAAADIMPTKTEVKTVKKRRSGSVYSVPKNPRDGQYWATGRVNSGHVKFLVDTGASSVALTYEDARKAGIKVRDLRYNVPISTAGGTNYAAYVKLDSVSLGAITIRDVDALVVKDGLTVSLLGMTYLGQLQKVEATPNALLLRL
ncbi:TIGR02281 family clan AA aspartic protease [Litorimonas sp. RW-G-Af-16]|uniref:TIGR02281 family clan AA aspartic protease n=1 Tax=Litorimonas sp. RW-G-Af-16 TaxID=3241168 RepID=UPI00390C8E08